jgi:hypothetical protein
MTNRDVPVSYWARDATIPPGEERSKVQDLEREGRKEKGRKKMSEKRTKVDSAV